MDERGQSERETVENMGRFIAAYGILQGIRCEDVASTQDAVEAVAKAYGYDLGTSTDRKKYQESCRKQALAYMEGKGIIEKVTPRDGEARTVAGQRYRIAEGREQEYKDLVYRAAYNQEQSENLSKWMKLGAKIGSLKKMFDIIPDALKLTPEATMKLLGHVGAVAKDICESLEWIDSTKKGLVQKAAEEVSAAVYGSAERSEALKKAYGDVKSALKETVSAIRHRMHRLPITATISEAHFSRRQEKEMNKKLERDFASGPKERRKGWIDLAFSMSAVREGYQADIFAAFADIDKGIRPDGPKIRREDVSEATRQDTRFRLGGILPFLDSVATAARYMKNQVADINPGLGLLHRISFVRRFQDVIPEPLYRTYHDHLMQKESLRYGRISGKGFLNKDDLGNAVIKIAHFNAVNQDSQQRGENYATEYAKLNLYRCGNSRFLVSAMHLFRMNPLDRIWAMAYMKAGMQETLHGIRFKSFAKDMDGIMHARSELREEAAKVFHQYTDGKSTREIKEVCRQMEMDFVREHSGMVERIARRREEQHLQPLQEVTYLDGRFGNAKDPGEKDHLDVEYVKREDAAQIDVERMQDVDGKDGFVLEDDHSLGLFLFSEIKGVVALTDQYANAVAMKVTDDTFHRSNQAIRLIPDEFDKTQEGMKTDFALSYIAWDKASRIADGSRAGWKPFVSEAVHNGCRVEIDTLLQNGPLLLTDRRTGVEMQVRDDEPTPGFGSVYVRQFADQVMQAEYQAVLRERGLTDEAMRGFTVDWDGLTRTEQLVLSHTDSGNEMDALRERLESYTQDTDPRKVFTAAKRGEILESIRNDTSPEQMAHMGQLH